MLITVYYVQRKCDQYWPSEGEHQYDHMSVKLLNTYTMAHYTIRVFTLKHLKLRKVSSVILQELACTTEHPWLLFAICLDSILPFTVLFY